MSTEGLTKVVEERLETANAIPWHLTKTEKIFLPIWVVIYGFHLIRQQIGFNFIPGKNILGLPTPIFEAWFWTILFTVFTITACSFWIREIRQRIEKSKSMKPKADGKGS